MRALGVVELKPPTKSFLQIGAVVKRPQVKILVLEQPLQPLDENVVLNTATAVHADLHLIGFEHFGEGSGGKLSPLGRY